MRCRKFWLPKFRISGPALTDIPYQSLENGFALAIFSFGLPEFSLAAAALRAGRQSRAVQLRKFWDEKIGYLAILLFPLSLAFTLLTFFKKKLSRLRTFKIPIICVGFNARTPSTERFLL